MSHPIAEADLNKNVGLLCSYPRCSCSNTNIVSHPIAEADLNKNVVCCVPTPGVLVLILALCHVQ